MNIIVLKKVLQLEIRQKNFIFYIRYTEDTLSSEYYVQLDCITIFFSSFS